MMLVVIANVEGQPVQRTIVGVRLLRIVEDVVLRNKMSCHWVDASGKDSRDAEVDKGSESVVDYDKVVKSELNDPVDCQIFAGWESFD